MKEQIIQKLIEYLDQSKDFMLQECPEVIQQALRYHYISNLMGCIFSFLGIIVYALVCFYFYKNPTRDKYDSRPMHHSFIFFLSPMFFFMFTFSLFNCCDHLIKITYAPKYYLIHLFF